MQHMGWLKVIYRRKLVVFCVILNVILVLVPVIFTLMEMGIFAKSPVLSTRVTASGDAPVLKVAAVEGFRSRVYRSENGTLSGLYMELVIEAANRLGMRPEVVCLEVPEANAALRSGEADLLVGVEPLEASPSILQTVPVARDAIYVYSASEHTVITEAASLAGKRVGRTVGMARSTEQPLDCIEVDYETPLALLWALERGEIDYALCSASIAKELMQEHRLLLKECFEWSGSYPSFGVSAARPELRQELNRVLAGMADDGTLQKLEEKWFFSQFSRFFLGDVIKDNSSFYLQYLFFMALMEGVMIIELLVRSDKKVRKQFEALKSMASIYTSMYLIGLEKNYMMEYSAQNAVRSCMTPDQNVAEQMHNIIRGTIAPEMLDAALEFTDLTTLPERMGKDRVLSKEFMDNQAGWIRTRFIVISYNETGNISEVAFVALSIDQEKEKEHYLLHIATTDELTGLHNRRAYEQRLNELRGALPEDLVVCSLDLNGLKEINDQQGHAAGDRMLKEAAVCMRQSFDSCGTVYRVGGDEFMALLKGDEQSLSEQKTAFLRRLETHARAAGLPLSVAFGSASRAAHPEMDIDLLVKQADQEMYRAKEAHYQNAAFDRRRR